MIDRWLEWGPPLLRGTALTIFLTVASFAFALVLGLVLALARLNRRRWYLYKPAQGFVELVRGTPLLVQLFYLYFVLPFVGITMDPILTGILGLGINYGAYMSEVYRAGIEADRPLPVGGGARPRDADPSDPPARRAPAGVPDRHPPDGKLPRVALQGHGDRRHHLHPRAPVQRPAPRRGDVPVLRDLHGGARHLLRISYPASRGVAWLERRMRIGA